MLCFYHKYKRRSEDEVDLVPNMERVTVPNADSNHQNSGNGGVHYVVPRDGSSDATEAHELQVYVSTSNGLQKVERVPSLSTRSVALNYIESSLSNSK